MAFFQHDRVRSRQLETGIGYIDTTALPDLTADQTKDVIGKVAAGTALSPLDADLFLETSYTPPPSRLESIAGGGRLPVGLVLGAVAAKVALAVDPYMPPTYHVPETVNKALDAVWDFLPGNDLSAALPTIPQQVPGLLVAAAATEFGRRWVDHRHSRNLDAHARDAQATLRAAIDDGTQAWDLTDARIEHPTVAFVGQGLSVPQSIAQDTRTGIIQVSDEPIRGVNVVLPAVANADASRRALALADVVHADTVMFFSAAPDDELFPASNTDPDSYGMSVDRIASLIGRIDEICLNHEPPVPPKPMVIVGNPRQAVTYLTDNVDPNLRPAMTTEQLSDRRDILSSERGVNIEIIDQTQVVIDAASRLAGAHPMVFSGTVDSHQAFSASFKQATSGRSGVNPGLEPIQFIYNLKDRNTEALAQQARPGAIAVIKDASRRESVVEHGMPSDRVLVVAELVRSKLTCYLGD